MNDDGLRLFAIASSQEFGRRSARYMGIELSLHEEREFEDGEHKIRPLCSVRNRHAVVIQSLYSDARQSLNDKLCRLLFMLGAVRDAAAGRVTAVIPYLGYARKDRKTKARDPVTTRYVARMFEAVGVNQVLTMDVHNLAAYQNAFHAATTDHLEATGLFVEYFAGALTEEEKARLIVVSPDVGGIARAESVRRQLERRIGQSIGSGFLEKRRSGGQVSGGALVGRVEGQAVILVDDLISSGTTLVRAAQICRRHGAQRIYAAATHGVFSGQADAAIGDPALERVVVTDTIPPFRLSPAVVAEKLAVLDAASLFGEAIRRIHSGGSLTEILPAD
jgi:ribose-phosphate pyrophosphokinase